MIPKLLVFVAFVVFYLLSMAVDGIDKKRRNTILLLSCVVLAYLAGTRQTWLWNDTFTYVADFNFSNNIFHYSQADSPIGYTEKGYHFLVVLIKTFTDNSVVYLSVISFLSFLLIYRELRDYSLYPMLGLCIYISRFMLGRNMMQIRACLAIAIIISFTYLVKKKKWWQYTIILLIGYQLHHSVLVAAPLLLLGVLNCNVSRKQIYLGLIISFIIAQFFGGYVRNIVSNSDWMMEMAYSYIQEGSEKAFANDLTNPVIWLQTILLLMFTYNEEQLKKMTEYYYIFRNAYFISTVILIVMCQYAVLSARTSTVFATYECMIIPLLIMLFTKKERTVSYAIVGAGLILLFILNWPSTISHIW